MGDYDHMGRAYDGLIKGIGRLSVAFLLSLVAAVSLFVLWLVK